MNHFYGFDWGTYHVSATGRYWLIQSDDRDDLPIEVDDLPVGGEWIADSTCGDLDLNGTE